MPRPPLERSWGAELGGAHDSSRTIPVEIYLFGMANWI
jgi:hypothetical protein